MKTPGSGRQAARGFALMALLTILALGGLYLLTRQLDSASVALAREEATQRVLAEAKAALIAYAATRNLGSGAGRPGDLPCPADNLLGNKAAACGNQPGTTGQTLRLGRLPWKSLGLSELRDDSGEPLWYAVSSHFKENSRIDRLNSDTMRLQAAGAFVATAGSITVRDATGNVLFDGAAGTGVVAVIIAPGAPIQRRDGLAQDRSAGNLLNPAHFLDYVAPAADLPVTATEDNANFIDSDAGNGFFAGPVRSQSGTLAANDRIAVITLADIAAAMEERVAAEVSHCLRDYAAQADNAGHLPWAASVAGSYNDVSGSRFGRLPDDFTNTVTDSSMACLLPPMLANWTGACLINSGNPWFLDNWREIVFFAVADSHKPACPNPAACGSCLTVNRPGGALANRQFAVFVAGRPVPGQVRATLADKALVSNYLELQNATPLDDLFETGNPAVNFNDRVRYHPQ
jgi:hypothetical protein